MERPKSQSKKDFESTEHHDLVSKILGGQVDTTVIRNDQLPSFLNAASATGFKVEKIADEGGEFPSVRYIYPDKSVVRSIKVERKDCIAVSIERPEGSKNFGLFWTNLRDVQRKSGQN